MALFGKPHGVQSEESACNRCERRTECWDRHRVRVRTIMPSLCELADELIKEGLTGEAYMRAFVTRTGQTTEQFAEPYMGVMMGNMEDGAHVASLEKPKECGAVSQLTWPLTPL